MDEEYGVFPLDAVSYTLCQPPNVIRECRGPGDFIGAAYQLRATLRFSCGGVKYPLEGGGNFPYGLHCMVGLCV